MFASTDPLTHETLWEGVAGDVDAAVTRARAAFPHWAALGHAARVACVEAFATVVSAQSEAFATLIARETGKPLWEAKTEVATTVGKVAISIEALDARAGTRSGPMAGATQVLRHKPHGVLAVLGPYNFPAHIPNGHIVPALLAGNSVVFKPSELTPAVAEFMGRCWREAGLPDGVLELVQGGGEAGRQLAAHADIDGLLFTGSSTTGVALHRQFAGQPGKILALEMGGNNPLILWDAAPDAMDAALSLVAQSAFATAGQRCTCARRLIVADAGSAALFDALRAYADRLIVGGQFDDPQPYMGSVISLGAAEGVRRGYKHLLESGGRIIRPLEDLRPGTPLLSPAIVDMTDVSARRDEEIFGPVLQVIRVGGFDEAIAVANDTKYGLSAGLIGGDQALYDRFWTQSRAGIVNWNRPTTGAASNAPFGGVGLSGNHRPSAYYAADYSAWPVASVETPRPEGTIAIGLRAEMADAVAGAC